MPRVSPKFLQWVFFLKTTTAVSRYVPVFGLLFVAAGAENQKGRHNRIEPMGRTGKTLAFVLGSEAVRSSLEPRTMLLRQGVGRIGHGVQRWTKRGYKHTSRMWYLFRIQVRNRSKPKPYPP